MSERISVIIPIYKVERYIHRCIDSVLQQTYENLEIILVDDGSPDGCPQICDTYAVLDSRVRVIHKENAGLGYARNSGMAICTGDYIMFVDSDDYLSRDAVQVLYERMVVDGSEVAVGKHTDIYENGDMNGFFCALMQDSVLTKDEIYANIAQYPVSAWGKLYKREVLEGIKYPSLKCAEDLWIFPEKIDRCNKISIVNATVYYYFQNAESITKKKSEQAKQDEVEAILRTTRFLLHRGFLESAQRYCSKGVARAMLVRDRRRVRNCFKAYITPLEKKQLFHGQGIKLRLKWLSLYLPFIYTIIQHIKNNGVR